MTDRQFENLYQNSRTFFSTKKKRLSQISKDSLKFKEIVKQNLTLINQKKDHYASF